MIHPNGFAVWVPKCRYRILRGAVAYEVQRYIHHNPVRRGLAATPPQWRYSSAAGWEAAGVGPLAIDRDSFPVFQPSPNSSNLRLPPKDTTERLLSRVCGGLLSIPGGGRNHQRLVVPRPFSAPVDPQTPPGTAPIDEVIAYLAHHLAQ